MKPFKEFFDEYVLNEYAHNNADGTPKQTLKAHNGKGGGANIGLDAKYQHTVGPYKKQVKKLDTLGSFIMPDELTKLGINPMVIPPGGIWKNVKNSKSWLRRVEQRVGDNILIVGQVIKASPGLGK